MTPYDLDLALKVLCAAVLGALIGYERQKYRKPAGIRTQILICVGSALLAGVSVHIADKYAIPGAASNPDPARLMAQIITGIGFLGAGVILKEERRISGVTTAATIWITAAVGIAVGAGFYLVAAICALLVLFLHPLAWVEHKAVSQNVIFSLNVAKENWKAVEAVLKKHSDVDYTLAAVSGGQTRLKVYSSQEEKQAIVDALMTQKIGFEIEDVR